MPDMEKRPYDHGSDRYGMVEIEAPPGVQPDEKAIDMLLAAGCKDCNPNYFIKYISGSAHAIVWDTTIAHDDTCPWLAAHEARGGGDAWPS